MKQKRTLAYVLVSDKAKKKLSTNHPWVYEGEILEVQGDIENGDLIDVFSANGNTYLGSGFYNESSKIRVRIISKNANDRFDRAFYERRIAHALDYRKSVMGEDCTNCRLIFGEADFFPGFTVDRFNDVLVTQITCLGIEKIKEMLYELLLDYFKKEKVAIRGIYERNDLKLRELEGLQQHIGWFYNDGNAATTTHIIENGIDYLVDFENGQKTGFFLDQKYNRLAVSKIAKDKKVLDCFTHTGSFGLNAKKGGAQRVVSLDISEKAIEDAKANALRNHLDVEYVCCDVFDYLDQLLKEKNKDFDFIILDPPAFTKSKETLKNAIKGYGEINMKAMRLLPRGGYLATCSCSHFMSEGYFKTMLHDASKAAGVQLRQISCTQQACDHPILWNVPETNYLKFFIFQVV